MKIIVNTFKMLIKINLYLLTYVHCIIRQFILSYNYVIQKTAVLPHAHYIKPERNVKHNIKSKK